jgi:hypothetical protein
MLAIVDRSGFLGLKIRRYLQHIPFYVCFFIWCFVSFSCRKPQNGNYTMTTTGEYRTTECSSYTNCVTFSNDTGSTKEIIIDHSRKKTVEIDGQAWVRDGDSVTFDNEISDQSPGSGSTKNYMYRGEIKNKFEIVGTYTISSSYRSMTGNSTETTNSGGFTIRRR